MILLTTDAETLDVMTLDVMTTDLACQIRGCTAPGSPQRTFVTALG